MLVRSVTRCTKMTVAEYCVCINMNNTYGIGYRELAQWLTAGMAEQLFDVIFPIIRIGLPHEWVSQKGGMGGGGGASV
jgi:hypothetical protein